MEVENRKHTWVHITYERDGTIEVYFVTDHWKRGEYIRRHRRIVKIKRSQYPRLNNLLKLLSRSTNVRYTIFAWNGYSVSWERRSKPGGSS